MLSDILTAAIVPLIAGLFAIIPNALPNARRVRRLEKLSSIRASLGSDHQGTANLDRAISQLTYSVRRDIEIQVRFQLKSTSIIGIALFTILAAGFTYFALQQSGVGRWILLVGAGLSMLMLVGPLSDLHEPSDPNARDEGPQKPSQFDLED